MATTPSLDQPVSKIQYTELLVVVWVLTGVACVLFGVRISIRLSVFRKLFLDDGFATLALLILIANSVITTVMAPPMYELLLVSAGLAPITPEFMERTTFYIKLQFASTVLFWSCLWAVKGCFLAFFYKMTEGLKPQRTMLWVVAVITALSYIGSVITYPISCTSFKPGECSEKINIDRSLISLRYSTAVDIITDLLIISIPVWLCWQVRISLKQKIGLYSVLCLGVVIIVFSIVRIIVTNAEGIQPEVSWLALWSSIESSVAVIVACLASFKALLTQRSRAKASQNSGGYQKHAQGTDSRSGAGGSGVRAYAQSREEHELQRFDGRITSPRVTAGDGKKPGVSEESIELRQSSFESQARILRGQ